LRTAIFTHVWNKILRSRDFYVSKAFKERLDFPLPNREEKWKWYGMVDG
jgi:hypothetical protein